MIVADRRALAKRSRLWHRCRSRSPMGATRRDDTREESPRERPNPTAKSGAALANHGARRMIPTEVWRSQVGPGQHRVLLALWDYAHGWRQGDGEWFVWPEIGTLAAKIGIKVRALYARLAGLESAGLIAREWSADLDRYGWRLTISTAAAEPEPECDEGQLGFAWASSGSANDRAPVDNLRMVEPDAAIASAQTCTPPLHERAQPSSLRTEVEQSGDDMTRAWLAYEAERVRVLGGLARSGRAPETMRALVAAKGLAAVIEYGRRAIELAAEAVKAGAPLADKLVRCRSDGGEWSERRFSAVALFRPTSPPRPIVMPPPDPVVDDRRVDLHEREAWESGGANAVRTLRRAVLSPEAMAAMARGALRTIGGAR